MIPHEPGDSSFDTIPPTLRAPEAPGPASGHSFARRGHFRVAPAAGDAMPARSAYLDTREVLGVLIRMRNHRFVLEITRSKTADTDPPTLREARPMGPSTTRHVAARVGLFPRREADPD